MCWLQDQTGTSLMAWPGMTTAPKSCVPLVDAGWATDGSRAWPDCIIHNAEILTGAASPVFADVTRFISHPDAVQHRVITFKSDGEIGMLLRERPHEYGEVVGDVLPGSQAYYAGVRKGWIIREVDGKAFQTIESLTDVGRDFSVAKGNAPTLVVKFDIRTNSDCTDGNCAMSDKFPAMTSSECAAACSQVPGCKWWSFGVEDADQMCFFRSLPNGIKPVVGSHTGMATCSPAGPWFSSGAGWSRWWIVVGLVVAYLFRDQLVPLLQELLPRIVHCVQALLSIPSALLGSGALSKGLDLGKDAVDRAQTLGASAQTTVQQLELPRIKGTIGSYWGDRAANGKERLSSASGPSSGYGSSA